MRYGTVDRDFAMRLASCPPELDGPVLMVNFMKYRERALYSDGSDDGITGREADDRYAPTHVLADIGARIVYVGDVVDEAGGPDPAWDRVAIVCYPTRRSFIEMQSRKEFQAKHVHKDAGMEFTINMTAVPLAGMAGVPDGSGLVRFVAWPEGSEAPEGVPEGSVLDVEGRILGDERRWSHLGVHYTAADDHPLPEGAMVVRTKPTLDRLRETIDGWHRA